MTRRYDLEQRYPDLLRQEDDQALYKLVNDLDAAYTRPEMPHHLTWATTRARAATILRLHKENMFMLDYPKALRSAGMAIALCLLLFPGWLMFYRSGGDVIPKYALSIWLSSIIAVGSLGWSFYRGKPHIVYAGLHAFCWLASFCMINILNLYFHMFSNTEGGSLFLIPTALSLLLCIFIQPILIGLSKLQRLFGLHKSASGVPKQGVEDLLLEDPFLYKEGYKAVQQEAVSADEEWSIPTIQSQAVSEEGEQHFPYHNRNLEPPQSHK